MIARRPAHKTRDHFTSRKNQVVLTNNTPRLSINSILTDDFYLFSLILIIQLFYNRNSNPPA